MRKSFDHQNKDLVDAPENVIAYPYIKILQIRFIAVNSEFKLNNIYNFLISYFAKCEF